MSSAFKSRWYFMTNPAESWFNDFTRYFQSPDFRIWVQDSEGVPDYYGWESQHLDDVSSSQEFVDRAAALKAVFDGALYITRGQSYRPIKLEKPNAYEDVDTKFIGFLPFRADVRVEPFSPSLIGRRNTDLQNPLCSSVSRMIFLARYDDIARAILKYTGVQGLSYVTLYAFRDWMKSGGWNDQRVATEAGWSKAQLNDFTNTANNPAYLGPFCRHGGVAPLPRRPVALEIADEPMRKAMQAFLDHRADLINLNSKWRAFDEH